MRALLLFALLPSLALAQGRAPTRPAPPGGGGGSPSTTAACGLAATGPAFASSYRATTATNTVSAYGCDAILTSCVKLGPGDKTSCGTNALGEVICGLVADSTGVWRFYGTAHAVTYSAVNVLASNQVLAGAVLDLGTNAFIRKTTGGVVPVIDPDGLGINNTSPIKGIVRASVTFDFPNIPNGDCVIQSLTVTGSTLGDYVSVNADFLLPADVGIGNARVTAANTVDLRLCNHDPSTGADPAAGAFLIRLER